MPARPKPTPKSKAKSAPRRPPVRAVRATPRHTAAPPAAPAAEDHAPLRAVEGGRARTEAIKSPESSRGKYVYCVIKSEEALKFGPIGIGTEPADVHTINYRDVAAVVSDTPIEVLDATRENVLAHERVNEAVMRQHTVIPMSFGTVFKTRDDIIELLKGAYSAFDDVLNKMQDKLEFGLKVLWDRDVILREIENEDEDVRRLKSEISSQKGSTYFARVQYGRLVDTALQTRSEHYVNEIFEGLRDVCVASRANKPIGDKMIMNAAFLVARDKEAVFDARVKEIGAAHDKLTFRYTGPWPPYNFVNIRLKLERAQEAE
jgi:Gas vesicle synthesis protein GvpL/GvpF